MDGRLDPNPTLPVDPDAIPGAPRPLHLRLSALMLIGVGGLVGAPMRYGLEVLFPTRAGGWPITTLVINVVGALLLGLLLEGLTRVGPDTGWRQQVRLCVGTGLLGSFTTYSTLAVDTGLLLRDQHSLTAAMYLAATVLAGLVAAAVGIALGARWETKRWESQRSEPAR